MTKYAIIAFVIALSCGPLSAQPCCERAVIDELYLPEDYFTPVFAAIDTPDTNPNPCDSCKLFFDLTDPVLHITDNNLDSLWAFLGRHFCTVDVESISYDDTSIYKEYNLVGIYMKESPLSAAKTTALINYVYNGGTLAILGDCCRLDNALNELLGDPRWNLGLSINSDVINDSVDYEGLWSMPTFRNFTDNPLVMDCDSIHLNKGGSLNIFAPAKRLIWGGDHAFSFVWDSLPDTVTIYEREPPVIAFSYFGEGVIFACSDMSIWHIAVFLPPYLDTYDNKKLSQNLFNCNIIPHFNYYPAKFSDVACFPETLDISVSIENYGMIESDSVRVKWETAILTTASPYVAVSDSTLSLLLPLDSYLPGDTVNLCIEAVCDTGGYWPFDSICWWYYLDPLVDSLGPTIERITIDSLYPGDTLLAYISDTSGIDTSSILILMNLDTVETFTFEAGTLAVWGFPDTASSVSVIIIVEDLYPCWDNVGSTAFTVDIRTGIVEIDKPEDFEIRAYPNPFNSAVTISISGECDSSLRIDIYDVNGRKVEPVTEPVEVSGGYAVSDFANAKLPSTGSGSVFAPLTKGGQGGSYIWRPAPSLPSGIYLVRATIPQQAAGAVCTKRVVYLK